MRRAARVRGGWLAGIAAIALGGWAGAGALAADAGGKQPEPGKPFRLPSSSLKSQIIWDANCEGPDGIGLAFGGQDQLADRGQPPTRILLDGEWQDIRDELRQKNVLQSHSDAARKLARQQKDAVAGARHAYLEGLAPDAEAKHSPGLPRLRTNCARRLPGLPASCRRRWKSGPATRRASCVSPARCSPGPRIRRMRPRGTSRPPGCPMPWSKWGKHSSTWSAWPRRSTPSRRAGR